MRRRQLLAGAAAVLAGCSILPAQQPVQRRQWPLDVSRVPALPPRRRGKVLLVRSVRAAPGLEGRGLQWLQPDGSVHIDFYEEWAVPPAQAVEDELRQWLGDAGVFSAVVAPGSRINADLVLEGELTAFSADLKAGVARASLALVLLDQRPSPIRVLLQRTEDAEVKLTGTDPPGLMDAMKAALVEVLRQSERDIVAAAR
jgi:cholesterol transport system auxiliary component